MTVSGTGIGKNAGAQALTLTSGALTGLTLGGADAGNYTVTAAADQ